MSGLIVFNIIFFFVPLGYGIVGSFSNWNPLQKTMEFTGIDNYIEIIQSSLFRISLKNTFIFSGSLIVLRTGLGLVIAAGLYSLNGTMAFFEVYIFAGNYADCSSFDGLGMGLSSACRTFKYATCSVWICR